MKMPVMLAHEFSKYSHKIVYPCYVQPKIDGIRMWFSMDGKTRSRNDKPLVVHPKLQEELRDFRNKCEYTLDGELYLPDKDFNELSGQCRKKTGPDYPIEYHVFDIIDLRLSFQDRVKEYVSSLVGYDWIKYVPTFLANSESGVNTFLDYFVNQNFEGVIIRNKNSRYEIKRSFHLQKLKPWKFLRARVLGTAEGKGKLKGMLGAFECMTEKGICFTCGSGMDDYQRKVFWTGELPTHIDVKYQELSSNGCPRFPVFTQAFYGKD